MVIFTWKRKLEGWKDPYFQGRKVEGKEIVKHLGATLDAKLIWGPQVERASKKACTIIWA